MKGIRARIAAIALALLVSGGALAGAATFYVDKAARGANSGGSWTDAWTSFSAIQWSRVTAGSVVEVAPGTYAEQMSIAVNGTASSPITVMATDDAGRTGTVTIDGGNSRSYGIFVEGDYVTVRGFSFVNTTSACVRLDRTTGCRVERITAGARGGRGIYLYFSSNNVISGANITNPVSTSSQTDGIFTSNGDNNIFEGIVYHDYNGNASPHVDGIQFYQESNFTIRNSWFEQHNNKTSDCQGIYATNSKGTCRIYNNVIKYLVTGSSLIYNGLPLDTNFTTLVYNNTLHVGNSPNGIHVDGARAVVKNNLIYGTGTTRIYHVMFDTPLSSWSNCDYNLYWNANGGSPGAPVAYASGSKTLAQMRSLGADQHSLEVNPNLNLTTLAPNAGSPALDAGADLGSLFTTDRTGLARPQNARWDIGAYEYRGTVVPVQISAPKNLRIVQ